MRDLNYFPLDIECNIYSMTTLHFENKTNKLLVATRDCKIYSIEYTNFKPHSREVEFTYIPNGAQIISLSSMRRGPDDYAIAITHSLSPINLSRQSLRTSFSGHSSRVDREYRYDQVKSMNYYLNIYATNLRTKEFELDQVAQGCQTLRLKYVPYHMHETYMIYRKEDGKTFFKKPLWLLSGGDNSIHAISEDTPFYSFNEMNIDDCFPELARLHSIALWIDVLYIEGDSSEYDRLTGVGFEDGAVKLYHSRFMHIRNRFEIVKISLFDDYTTIIPSVRFFRTHSTYKCKISDLYKSHMKTPERIDKIDLLVVSSTNSCLIFEDVVNYGLDRKYSLPNSERLDCSVSSDIGDINLDGYNEIIIGTYGREILTYCYDEDTENYQLKGLLEMNQPVFALNVFGITNDVLKEVVIMLVNGILVMQSNVDQALTICKRRIANILSILGEAGAPD